MLERYLIDVLTAKFGQYISNLNDTDKIHLSAWRGEVFLSNLRLNPEAISSKLFQGQENPPIQILFGNIGQFELQIPWRILRRKCFWRSTTATTSTFPLSSPSSSSSSSKMKSEYDPEFPNSNKDSTEKENERCSIVLSDVHILLSSPSHESSSSRLNSRRAVKEREVQRVLETLLRQTLLQDKDNEPAVVPRYWKWAKQLISYMLSTLKVTVKNVHIRYEDLGIRKTGAPESFGVDVMRRDGFTIGITLRRFIVENIENSDEEQRVDGDNSGSHEIKKNNKIAAIDELAVYWDSNCENDLMSLAWLKHEELKRKEEEERKRKPRRSKRQRHRRSTSNDDAENATIPSNQHSQRSMTSTTEHAVLEKANFFNDKEDFFVSIFENMSSSHTDHIHKEEYMETYKTESTPLHSYLLEPISPTFYFTLSDFTTSVSEEQTNHVENVSYSQSPPPPPLIEAQAIVPSCQFSFSRDIIEDLAYLRQAIAHAEISKDNDLSDEYLLHLATLRPKERPDKAPRLWWKYAFHATRTILEQTTCHRRRDRIGWLGLARILRLRHQYILLYRDYLEATESEKNIALLELEDELETQEIAAFRAYVHVTMDQKLYQDINSLPRSGSIIPSSLEYFKQEAQLLSEIAMASERASNSNSVGILSLTDSECVKWTIAVEFLDFRLELSDKASPIALLSCSAMQKFTVKYGGNWIVDCASANLQITDLMTDGNPSLLSRKEILEQESLSDSVVFNNLCLPHSASIFIENSASTTFVRIRLSPLQAMYSTLPIYSLHRIFSAAKTPEFSSDYERLKKSMVIWRARQSAKLRKALAERRKFITEIDVAAPIVFIPEEERMVIVDLGHFTFCNDDSSNSAEEDSWKLVLSNMQVLLSYSHLISCLSNATLDSSYALVEPFSIELLMNTNFSKKDINQISINATLPRLVFNLTTSTSRLMKKLVNKWDESKKRKLKSSIENNNGPDSEILSTNVDIDSETNHDEIDRFSVFEFEFSAPFIALNIENDVDGRDCLNGSSTPLLQLTLQRIRGNYLKDSNITFSASLGALHAIDLYQRAGKKFEMLLSSSKQIHIDTDLVKVEYISFSEREKGSNLSISFNELYVEWNPETIAALQKALRDPLRNATKNTFDSPSILNHNENTDRFEVMESHLQDLSLNISPNSRLDRNTSSNQLFKRDETSGADESNINELDDSNKKSDAKQDSGETVPFTKNVSNPPFRLIFSLSNLFINFNKESRKRRLASAQMVQTNVQYLTKPTGGIQIKATIGNLTFEDIGTAGGTLYSQFVGLKMMRQQQSLVHLEYESYPRIPRNYSEGDDYNVSGVEIDEERGRITGYDAYLSLRFSPMRFVLVQQLWLEIFDYLFEGILGYEVWGAVRPPDAPPIEEIKKNLDVRASDNIRFLHFSIDMDAPIFVLPVAYRSPHHLRLELSRMKITNHFSGESKNSPLCIPMQWYNNCSVTLSGLNVLNWQGKNISSHEILLRTSVKWPVGYTAPLILPKWNVNFSMGEVALSLQREDYALFRNFLFYNIMGETRNLEEWKIHKKHLSKEMVNYGYDFKDHPPTSYKINFEIDAIVIQLLNSNSGLGDIKCEQLCYSLRKVSDQVLNQSLTCTSVVLTNVTEHEELGAFTKLLLPVQADKVDSVSSKPMIVYKSATRPNSDHFKTLEINNACIFLIYPAWICMQNFFSNAPGPDIFSENTVSNLIQIGDRWYPINDDGSSDLRYVLDSSNEAKAQSSFQVDDSKPIPSYQFRLLLNTPRIVLLPCTKIDDEHLCKGVTLGLGHFEYFYNVLSNGTCTTEFFIHALEVFTNIAKNPKKDSAHDSSLLHPLNIVACIKLENRTKLVKIVSETIRARAAYTDMSLAMNVVSKLINDMHNPNEFSKSNELRREQAQVTKELSKRNNDEKRKTDGKLNLPISTEISASFHGFNLLVIDNSLHHFACSQELIKVSLGMLDYNFKGVSKEEDNRMNTTNIRLKSLQIIDCLQPWRSQYRVIANSRALQKDADESTEGEHTFSERSKMIWEDFCTYKDPIWGYASSKPMAQWFDTHYTSNILNQLHERKSSKQLDLIEVFHTGVENKSDEIVLRFRTFLVQWNPSTIIALKRFIGKLTMEEGLKRNPFSNSSLTRSDASDILETEINVMGKDTTKRKKLKASFHVEQLTVCLNKEHQSRRLLEATFSDTFVAFERDLANQLDVQGTVGDIFAIDPSLTSSNRVLLEVVREGCEHEKLLRFTFLTFSGGIPKTSDDWVWKKAGEVDDYLFVKLLAIRTVYVRDRTSELIDYLSNGLPAAGIDATTRAAKGFLECRIKTRSAMEIQIEAPTIVIPRHPNTDISIIMRLGDIEVKSWFEEGNEKDLDHKMTSDLSLDNNCDESSSKTSNEPTNDSVQSDWWRCLSIKMSGMGHNSFLSDHVDFHLILRKPSWFSKTAVIRGRLTYVEAVINYQDWAIFRAVINDNIGKAVDESGWDNIEKKAAEEDAKMEIKELAKDTIAENISKVVPVEYVEGAQVIRYGNKQQNVEADADRNNTNDAGTTPTLDFEFELDGLCLTLHRNDPILVTLSTQNPYNKSEINYDLARLRVRRVSVGISSYASGDTSAHIKLYRMELRDLGDQGRNVREALLSSTGSLGMQEVIQREPSVFSVICEGYNPTEKKEEATEAPQLVFTFDMSHLSSPVARVVVDYLSMYALVRPIIEILEFLSCAWPIQKLSVSANLNKKGEESNVVPLQLDSSETTRENRFWKILDNQSNAPPNEDHNNGFQIKLVAHYPRIFLIADENKPSTRALVLRGLAVINLSSAKELVTAACDNEANWSDFRTTISLDAHLNSMESYINPDMSQSYISNIHSPASAKYFTQNSKDAHNELGIALIEPVTASIEFNQVQRNLHPTHRSISVGMNPVSTMLSFEDLSLIEAVLGRMSEEGNRAVKDRQLRDQVDPMMSSDSNDNTEFGKDDNDEMEADEQSHDEHHFIDQPTDSRSRNSLVFQGSTFDMFENLQEYDVTFTDEKLGLVLRKSGGDFKVESVLVKVLNGRIKQGDVLVSIGGKFVSRLPFPTVKQLLHNMPRPIKLTFRKTQNSEMATSSKQEVHDFSNIYENERSNSLNSTLLSEQISGKHELTDPELEQGALFQSKSMNIYKIGFKSGLPNGLTFERSKVGDVAIVKNLDPSEFKCSYTILNVNDSQTRMTVPQPGAVILKINEEPTSSMGFWKTLDLLESLISPMNEETSNSRYNQSSYTITFLDANSSDWACIDRLEITIAGLKLTIIDDINGRDMPLVRGSLTNFDVYIHRGMGLKTYSIKVPPPSIFQVPWKRSDRSSGSDLSELILKFKSGAKTGLEYYNARIALWEPLVETCWLQIQLEWQAGNASLPQPRPGNFSFLITDKVTRNDKQSWFDQDEPNKSVHSEAKADETPSYVHINVTDAVMEMIIKTANELNEWRKTGFGEDTVETATAVVMNWHESSIGSPSKTLLSNAATMETPRLQLSSPIRTSNSLLHNEIYISSHADKELTNLHSITETVHNEGSYVQSISNFATQQLTPMSSPVRSPALQKMSNNDAAQKAAKAALQFARKRGAATQKKGDWAKPFVLRNKTGVPIAFVQQTRKIKNRQENMGVNTESSTTNSDRRAYKDYFPNYDLSNIKEVKSGCEALFSMDVMDALNSSSHKLDESNNTQIQFGSKNGKRVRGYDGQFPFLSIALDPSLRVFRPLKDLPVVKVGQTIRKLLIRNHRNSGNDEFQNTERYLVMVWTVELENNRRILTLSSAVSIASTGCGMLIEIGYKISQIGDIRDNQVEKSKRSSQAVESLGIAKPGSPFFLPLWLCVNSGVVIYVRPLGISLKTRDDHNYRENSTPSMESSAYDISTDRDLSPREEIRKDFYEWSSEGILEFTCDQSNLPMNTQSTTLRMKDTESSNETVYRWKWRQITSQHPYKDKLNLSKVLCLPTSSREYVHPVWLSCIGTVETLRKVALPTLEVEESINKANRTNFLEQVQFHSDLDTILTISVGSTFTLRNLLPINLDWEVAILSDDKINPSECLDGSKLRKQQFDRYKFIPLAALEEFEYPSEGSQTSESFDENLKVRRSFSLSPGTLESGSGVEIFSCDISKMQVHARFRYKNKNASWSQWALMRFPYEENMSDDLSKKAKAKGSATSNNDEASVHIHGHQLTVQSNKENDMPLTFGIKLIPKLPSFSQYSSHMNSNICGIDVVLYAELWMRNLSHLDLTFGVPDLQIFEMKDNSLEGNADTAAAEATLMEIASVLELGDKGKPLRSNTKFQSLYIGGEICNLPYQNQTEEVYEEIFEYIEVEFSTVKLRWWASEKHDKIRPKPSLTDSNKIRHSKNDNFGWKIDCSGQTRPEAEGWESSSKLDDFHDGTLLSRRLFDPSHRYRRRRWFRKRPVFRSVEGRNMNDENDECASESSIMFHHPVIHSATKNHVENHQSIANFISQRFDEFHRMEQKDSIKHAVDFTKVNPNDLPTRVCVRCGDGRWSVPIVIPPSGNGHGVIRLYASRWRLLLENKDEKNSASSQRTKAVHSSDHTQETQLFSKGCLSPGAYDLSYHLSELDGPWGDVSRLLMISSRFLIRNDSKVYEIDIKQVGAPISSIVRLKMGEIIPFHWTDVRLPELVCVRPIIPMDESVNDIDQKDHDHYFKWSGAFDLSTLGMLSLRIRKKNITHGLDEHEHEQNDDSRFNLRTLRAHVEIRPGTDGTGITLSLREENPSGEGSLFRIENCSPFPLWIAQDGVLSDPTSLPQMRSDHGVSTNFALNSPGKSPKAEGKGGAPIASEFTNSEMRDGELIEPMGCLAFGLDVPFRQGKYAHRRAASIAELLMLRVSLAPLSTREGIETTQVISLTTVGNNVRLSPTKLSTSLNDTFITQLLGVRVLGTVCADGPTRVVRFCLMEKDITATSALGSAVRRTAKQSEAYLEKMTDGNPALPFLSMTTNLNDSVDFDELRKLRINAAAKTIKLIKTGNLMRQDDARKHALRGEGIFHQRLKMTIGSRTIMKYFDSVDVCQQTQAEKPTVKEKEAVCDTHFMLKSSFQGFVVSIVDSVPSEIAVVALRSVDIIAKWNTFRTSDASVIVSVGWLQVDNHCPNAPYPVALYPIDKQIDIKGEKRIHSQQPFLTIGVTFAPQHTSGIPCLRAITLAPRDVAISLDLAFIMRMQKFLLGIREHLAESQHAANFVGIISREDLTFSESNSKWTFPDLSKMFKTRVEDANTGKGTQKLYFEGLTILPCYVSLSVAQARALTKAQAVLEGNEAAAVHAAVRKGDLLLGDGAGVLNVKVGSQNASALAVIRGVFKSILVDALLRCDAAVLNFPGVAIRNHISSTPQLATYLTAHYFAALRSNVPTLIGSLSAFGNPIGLIRGLGDGVSDFVSEPIRGLKKSVEELDPTLFVDGVARGTGSLARHAVGGFADTASLLTETLSKNMAVLTLDRKYAQKRDLGQMESEFNIDGSKKTFVDGVGSGSVKLVKGFLDGVTGVVRAPIRGAEKKGMEGFAKGVGKGLLGLVVKPVIGISDAATDVMIGVKGSVEGSHGDANKNIRCSQIRPRRAFYGRERALRIYRLEDATASKVMIRTRLAGDLYTSHCFVGNRMVIIGVKRFVLLAEDGRDRMVLKFKHIKQIEVRNVPRPDGDYEWGILIFLRMPKKKGSEVEAINCGDKATAVELCGKLNRSLGFAKMEVMYE